MSKYNRRGNSKVYFVPTIASQSAPTVAEITAGSYLGVGLREMTGFETQVSRISEPVLHSTVNPQISGEQTFGDAQIVMLESDAGTTDPDTTALQAAYTALADGAQGYIVAIPFGGIVATKKCEVWPVSIGANNRRWSTDNEFAKYGVNFAVLSAPQKNATIAA
jgi:hypothetical protein